jgi:hypothetical protein
MEDGLKNTSRGLVAGRILPHEEPWVFTRRLTVPVIVDRLASSCNGDACRSGVKILDGSGHTGCSGRSPAFEMNR